MKSPAHLHQHRSAGAENEVQEVDRRTIKREVHPCIPMLICSRNCDQQQDRPDARYRSKQNNWRTGLKHELENRWSQQIEEELARQCPRHAIPGLSNVRISWYPAVHQEKVGNCSPQSRNNCRSQICKSCKKSNRS